MNTKFNLESAFRSLFNPSLLRLYTFVPKTPLSQFRSLVPRTANMANNNSYNFDFNRIASLEASQAALQDSQNDIRAKYETVVAKLERELDDQKTARKKVEKELQHSRLAEKIARDALAQLRSSHIMSQDATGSKEKEAALKKEQSEASKDPPIETPRDGYTWVEDRYIQEMVKRLEALEKHKGMVEEQMRIYQKRNEDQIVRLKENRDDLCQMQSEIDKSHKKIGDQQDQLYYADQKYQQILNAAAHDLNVELDTARADLKTRKGRIDDLEKELQQKTEKASIAYDGLAKAEEDKGKLLQEAKEWTEKTTYLTEVNNALLEDIKKSNNQNEAVAHERDELKLSLAEAENALADITAAETASRDTHTLLAKKMQETADITHEDRASLQKNFDDVLCQMDDLKKEAAMKDFTIARKDKKIRDLMQEDADRATVTPQGGFFGTKSLAEELSATGYEEQGSETDDERSEPEPAALQLSAVTGSSTAPVPSPSPSPAIPLQLSAVSGISTAPVPDPAPQLSAVTGVSTAPVRGAPDVSSLSQLRSHPTPSLYAIIAVVLYLYLQVSSKLQAWEGANGVSFGEGYGGKFAYKGAYEGYN